MEVAGVGFQSRTSCALLPARLRALSRPSMGAFRAYAARGQRRGIPPRTTEYRRSHPYGRFRPGIPRTLRRSTFRVVCTARTVWFDSRSINKTATDQGDQSPFYWRWRESPLRYGAILAPCSGPGCSLPRPSMAAHPRYRSALAPVRLPSGADIKNEARLAASLVF